LGKPGTRRDAEDIEGDVAEWAVGDKVLKGSCWWELGVGYASVVGSRSKFATTMVKSGWYGTYLTAMSGSSH
jgi:hypothetical protein